MITGSAIISRNGMIADHFGSMAMLVHEHDSQWLQDYLDQTQAICVMGRKTHEHHPNRRARIRYVLSRTDHTDTATETFFTNSDQLFATIQSLAQQNFCILGGGQIYALFGVQRLFDQFFLSIRPGVTIDEGAALDPNTPFQSADHTMKNWGLGTGSMVYKQPDLYQTLYPSTPSPGIKS